MKKDINQLFEFLIATEKLKQDVRHSWTGNKNRQESVAEHTWFMALFAIVFFPNLSKKVDQLKTLKMIIVHDLAEAMTGDIPAQEISARKTRKAENESKAMKRLIKLLPYQKVRNEVLSLWEEYEKGESPEAELVKMIDKTEVLVQHNISDITTWDYTEYPLALYAKDYLSDFDKFTRAFKDQLDIWTVTKICKESDISKINPDELKLFKQKNKRNKNLKNILN